MPRCQPASGSDRPPSPDVVCGSSTGLVCNPPTGIPKLPDRTPAPTGTSIGNAPDSEKTRVRYGLGRPRCTPGIGCIRYPNIAGTAAVTACDRGSDTMF